MTRLIDADALKESLKSSCKPELCHDYNTAWCESCCKVNDFEDLIDNAPTVAVETVKQKAEWEEGTQGWFCSNCYYDDKFHYEHNFCPNCGANMQKGGAE